MTPLNEEKNFATMAAKYTQEKCDVSSAYRPDSVVLSKCCSLLSVTYQRWQCVCVCVSGACECCVFDSVFIYCLMVV